MARWVVFGRKEYAEPLRDQGSIEASNDQEASRLALDRHGRDWVELTLIPEASIRWVLRQSEADRE